MTDALRTRHIKAIHTAKRALALDDGSYRALLRRVTGQESCRAMSVAQLAAVMEEFRRLGFRKTPGKAGRPRFADSPHMRKIRALWIALHREGAIGDSSERALAAFVRRQTGLDMGRLAPEEGNRVVEGLKAWLARAAHDPVAAVRRRLGARAGDPAALIDALWEELIARGAMRTGIFARLDTWLHHRGFAVAAPQFLDERQAARVVRDLSAWLRRHAATAGDPEAG